MNIPDKILIKCPQCSNQYEIEVDSISEEGTNLKCASCDHEWAVKKVVEPAQQNNQDQADKDPKPDNKPNPNDPSVPYRRSNQNADDPSKKTATKQVSLGGCMIYGVLVPVFFFVFGAFVVASRQSIINVMPAISSVYELWGIKTPQSHLTVVSSEASLINEYESTTLIISGLIANKGIGLVNSMPVRVALLDDSGQKLAEKYVTLSQAELAPGSTWEYKVEFRNPPPNWHSHEVTIVGVSRSH